MWVVGAHQETATNLTTVLQRNLWGFLMLHKKILFYLFASITLMSAPSMANNNTAGELELSLQSGDTESALLLDTHLSGAITGMIASIKLEQRFKNQSNEWVNGRYVFPLPEDAAVDSFTIKIGERMIEGVVQEKQAAQRAFQQAKREGKKAGLLKQHRPNLFSISIANIGPDEEVITELTFVDTVTFEDGIFSLTLPTTLTPRYIPGATTKIKQALEQHVAEQLNEQQQERRHVEISTNSGWAANTHRVDDAADITPPQTHRLADQTSHQFSLALLLNAGLSLQKVQSSSHRINAQFANNGQVDISLAQTKLPMNQDLILSWQPAIGAAPEAAFFQQAFDDAYYSMLMLMPPQVSTPMSLPRDITFIIDSSGSMAGTPMNQAKQALHDGLSYLSPNDRFNIIDFDSSFTPLFKQSEAVTMKGLKKAHKMINLLHADGGTEMSGALSYALNSPHDSAYLKQIVFITDGAIGNEKELFKLIEQQLGDTRLFTVGIGSAPNAYFMNKAAQFGRGTYTFINNVNQVSEKIELLFEKITNPIMRDVKIAWPTDVEQYPQRIPDLYLGQPLTVIVKSSSAIKQADIEGHLLNTAWQQTVALVNNKQAETTTLDKRAENLDTLWARKKIAQLMDQLAIGQRTLEEVKPIVTALGITHRIVTKYTSFIAIEQTPSKPIEATSTHKNVPNLMPKGSTMPAPQTATPAGLLTLCGGLLMLISLGLRCIRRRNAILRTATT